MLKKPHHDQATGAQEEEYRKFYFKADIKQSRLAMLLFAIPIAGFMFNDFALYGWSAGFLGFAALRFSLLLVTGVEFFYIAKVKTYRSYDLILFSAITAIMAGGGVINALRPQGFVVEVIITIISVFVLYLVVPFRFLYQSILSSAATIGETLIVLLILKPTNPSVTFTLLFTMFLANLIGAASSWQVHAYRRRAFSEYRENQAAQHALEQQTKHLEELVVERTEKLQRAERFAAIGETASMVGHDLRNPLTGIASAAYFLKKKYGPQMDDAGRAMLKVIESNVAYSDKIINDLLDYSRNIILNLTKTNLKLLVGKAIALINAPTNVEVVDSTGNPPEIIVDETKIIRVLANLMKNAVDAMPQGGKLTVRSEDLDGEVRILVSDTGEGISEEDQKKLFQPLFTTKAKGMGFGLAICQRIIEAHHGRISVESTPGKGTTFKINIPKNHEDRKLSGYTNH